MNEAPPSAALGLSQHTQILENRSNRMFETEIITMKGS